MKKCFLFVLFLALVTTTVAYCGSHGWWTTGSSLATSYSPASLSPFFWGDTSQLSFMVKDASDGVSVWVDRSGNGNNATYVNAKPVYSATAINGRPGLTQDGAVSQQAMALTTPFDGGPFTALVVGKLNSAGNQAFLGRNVGATVAGFLISLNGGGWETYDGVGAYRDYSLSFSTGQAYVWSVVSDGTASGTQAYLNGTPLGVAGTGAGTYDFAGYPIDLIGARRNGAWHVDGAYSEILIVRRTVSAGEHMDLLQYEKTKWGIL